MAIDTSSYPIPVARTVADLRAQIREWRSAGARIALVPTMGALHAGHLSLVDLAATQADKVKVIVSIFVNPTQFAPNEDFTAYPRTEAADAGKLAGKAHLIFAPNAAEMYPDGFSTTVSVSGVTEPLEGAARPTHFAGVATVVAKLLLQALPDIAIFGEKDFQQLLTIRRMTQDLNIPVEIIGGPIMREPDGLAMSSRNAYLSAQERQIAGKLNRILADTANAVAAGQPVAETLSKGADRIREAGFDQVDYLALCDARNLASLDRFDGQPARLLVAARIGKTRLIDNMPVSA